MPSLLEFLRMNKIFNPDTPSESYITPGEVSFPPNPTPTVTIPPPTHDDIGIQPGVNDQYYTPEHTASDRLNTLMGNMPVRQSPNLLHKIGGSIVGMGYGPEAGVNAAYAPFNRQVEDWERQLKPAEQAAIIERTNNSQERIAAGQRKTAENTERRIEETERHNRETEELNRTKEERTAEIQRKRAAVYEFKATHPDWKAEQDSKGNLWFINPQDPTMKVDTGLDQVTDMDKVQLGITGRIAAIKETGRQQRETENVRSENTKKEIGVRTAGSILTKKTPSAAQAQKKEPTQSITEMTPDGLKRTTTSNLPVPPPVKKVRVLSPDGKTFGYIPESELEIAKKQGYKEAPK